MKSILKLGALALAFMLVGAGCADTLSLNNCVHTTLWGSCVTEDGADTAILGTWTLQSQQVVTPTGTIENPFNGRTITFTENGTFNAYAEDWSPELVENEVTTPSDGTVSNRCETEGNKGGSWAAVVGEAFGDNNIMELWVVPTTGDGPVVTCEADNSMIEVTSTNASTPLGVGPAIDADTGATATATSTNAYVLYTYSISEDGSLLSIVQENPFGHSGVPSPTPGGILNSYLFVR